MSLNPSTSWKLRSDSHRSIEFIDEIDNEVFSDQLIDGKYLSIASFQSVAVNQSLDHNIDSKQYVLSIEYFRSYENGGIVDLYVCGIYVSRLDALWTNGNRFSSRESKQLQL